MHIKISQQSIVSALGQGLKAQLNALQNCRSALQALKVSEAGLETYVASVAGLEQITLPDALLQYDCRNHRLAELALQTDGFDKTIAAAKQRYGAGRIAVLAATTASGLESSEQAYQHMSHNNTKQWPSSFSYRHTAYGGALSEFIARRLGLTGLRYTIGNACTSSLSAFAEAELLLTAGLADAVIVAGVETLSQTTLYGFHALDLLSPSPCAPCDQNRSGLNLGEAAGLVLLEKAETTENGLYVSAVGQSSDAYHISSPSPAADGTVYSMRAALQQAKLQAQDIVYINSHGTASLVNDLAEDQAILRVFGANTPYSSTKGWTGHTLGAAGIISTIFTGLALQHQTLWGTLNLKTTDNKICGHVLKQHQTITANATQHALVHAIGFGGSNASLILTQVQMT